MEFSELLIAALLAAILVVLVKLLKASTNSKAGTAQVPAAPEQKAQEPFDLEFHFKNRKEEDLAEINAELAKHTLSNLEVVNSKGYVTTETVTKGSSPDKKIRYWYGLDDCVLRCTPATAKERYHYQLSTMVFTKEEQNCHEQLCKSLPNRTVRTTIEYEFAEVKAMLALHHEKKKF